MLSDKGSDNGSFLNYGTDWERPKRHLCTYAFDAIAVRSSPLPLSHQ